MLRKIVIWYVSSNSPLRLQIKQFVRRHSIIRSFGVAVISVLLRPKHTLQRAYQTVFPSRLSRAASSRAIKAQRPHLETTINSGAKFHVVVLNDVGFQYGAGIALRRQVASFLLNGWQVTAVSHLRWRTPRYASISGFKDIDHAVPIHMAQASTDGKATEVADIVADLDPDLVVTGNLHGTRQASSILTHLRERQIPIVAYMHDCFWATGRCAYMEGCRKYLTGCDDTCPTPSEYPALAPELIANEWRDREKLFTGVDRIPLVANSNWTRNVTLGRFRASASVDMIHLGIDHQLFSPLDRKEARQLLRLPEDKFIVAMGAIDINSRWKGGAIFSELFESLSQRQDIGVILLGSGSSELNSLKSFGLIEDEREIPLILSAANLFVSTAIEEAFGQMLLEAAACGIPSVAFDVGGIGDIVTSETGILVQEQSARALEAAISTVANDIALSRRLGKAARLRVEQQFTLNHQATEWSKYILERGYTSK